MAFLVKGTANGWGGRVGVVRMGVYRLGRLWLICRACARRRRGKRRQSSGERHKAAWRVPKAFHVHLSLIIYTSLSAEDPVTCTSRGYRLLLFQSSCLAWLAHLWHLTLRNDAHADAYRYRYCVTVLSLGYPSTRVSTEASLV